jgi:nicotinamidase-related amidase
MSKQRSDPLGNTPEKSPVALLLIDVINEFNFPEADQLFEFAVPMSHRIAEVKRRANQFDVPVIYVNDNFGRWRSDFKAQVEHCLKQEGTGHEIVERLQPDKNDYFVLKPRHSGFYSTTLEILLDDMGAHHLVLTGLAANICVLFTANDAYMRGYKLWVPNDCVASNTQEENDYAIEQMQNILKANTRPSGEIEWQSLTQKEC